jgi:hypothetical protein
MILGKHKLTTREIFFCFLITGFLIYLRKKICYIYEVLLFVEKKINLPEKTFPEKTEGFLRPQSVGLVTSAQRVPAQIKKKKNWDNFLGANLKVCHPKGRGLAVYDFYI